MNQQYLLMNKLDGITIELSQDKSQATEQIMNALYLNLKSNYSDVITNILKIKHLYFVHSTNCSFVELLTYFHSILEQYEMEIINDPSEAILFNANFDTDLMFESPMDKQQYINEWFRVNTSRINFDGKNLEFNNKFIEELATNARKQLKKHKLNVNDKLIYSYIAPSISDIDTQAIDEIQQEFTNYIQHIEQQLGDENGVI